jgi:DNA-binding IclR family transcriptional regulator
MAALQTADRVLSALFFLAEVREAGPSAVARQLGVSRATAFNLLRTLEKHGLASFNRDTQSYRLGPAVYRFAPISAPYSDLASAARPFLEHLRNAVNETVTLHIRIGRERICIERVESTHQVRRTASVGERWPLNTGATGLVLLAWMPDVELARFLAVAPLVALTPRTITDPDVLTATLAEVRAQGYAIREEDPVLGASSVSVPVFGPRDTLMAALTVSGPSGRWTVAEMRRWLPLIRQVGTDISTALGYEKRVNMHSSPPANGVASGADDHVRPAGLEVN